MAGASSFADAVAAFDSLARLGRAAAEEQIQGGYVLARPAEMPTMPTPAPAPAPAPQSTASLDVRTYERLRKIGSRITPLALGEWTAAQVESAAQWLDDVEKFRDLIHTDTPEPQPPPHVRPTLR
jgi:hypothetical protein